MKIQRTRMVKMLKLIALQASIFALCTMKQVVSQDTCAELDGECYTNDLECCSEVHDCDEGFCHIRIFFPAHGQTCGEDCGNTICSLLSEECRDGVCQPALDAECAALASACSNFVPCCDPDHDCIVSPELDTSDNFANNGFCEIAGARTGEACSDDDSCRFSFDICVDSVCKVHPDMQEDASEKTTVSVSANAYDTRSSANNGCGTTGCLPELTRDGSTDPESRWSCAKSLGYGTCFIEYAFGTPQDVISINIAFYKGDERTRTILVYGDDALLGSFMSSGSTLDFENWTINADDVSSIRLEASGLGDSEWLSITEVELLDRNYASSC